MRSLINKQNLNKVPCIIVEYKFVRAMFTKVGDVPPTLLKHQLKPFLVFLHFSNLQISTWYKEQILVFTWKKTQNYKKNKEVKINLGILGWLNT